MSDISSQLRGRPAWRTAAIVVGSLLGLATILALTMLLHNTGPGSTAAANPTTRPAIEQARAQDQQQLTQFHWIDRAAGEVSLPIELAMEKVIAESQKTPAKPVAKPATGAG